MKFNIPLSDTVVVSTNVSLTLDADGNPVVTAQETATDTTNNNTANIGEPQTIVLTADQQTGLGAAIQAFLQPIVQAAQVPAPAQS